MSQIEAAPTMLRRAALLKRVPELNGPMLKYLASTGAIGFDRLNPENPTSDRLFNLQHAQAWAKKHRGRPPADYFSVPFVCEQFPWLDSHTVRAWCDYCPPLEQQRIAAGGDPDSAVKASVRSWPPPEERLSHRKIYVHYGDIVDATRWFLPELPDSFDDAPPDGYSGVSLKKVRAIQRSKIHSPKGKPVTSTADYRLRTSATTIYDWCNVECPPLGRDPTNLTKFKKLASYTFCKQGTTQKRTYITDADVETIKKFNEEALAEGDITRPAALTEIGGKRPRTLIEKKFKRARTPASEQPVDAELFETKFRIVKIKTEAGKGKKKRASHTRFIRQPVYGSKDITSAKKDVEAIDPKKWSLIRPMARRWPVPGLSVGRSRTLLYEAIKGQRVSGEMKDVPRSSTRCKKREMYYSVPEWQQEIKRIEAQKESVQKLPRPGEHGREIVDVEGTWWPTLETVQRIGGNAIATTVNLANWRVACPYTDNGVLRGRRTKVQLYPEWNAREHWFYLQDDSDQIHRRLNGLPEPVAEKASIKTTTVPTLAANGERPLNPLQQEILIAMLKLKATDPNRRRTAEEITVEANKFGDVNTYKKPFAALVKINLVAVKLGRSGGGWLTDIGKSLAEQL